MINFVNFNEQWIDNVMMNEFEILVTEPVFHIAFSTSKKIIGNYDLVALHHQIVSQMRANETSPTSNLTKRQKVDFLGKFRIEKGNFFLVTHQNPFPIFVIQI